MSFFAILPALLAGLLALVFLFNAEKQEDFVGKFWFFLIGLLFLWLTVFLLKLGIKTSNKIEDYNPNNIEYIDDY